MRHAALAALTALTGACDDSAALSLGGGDRADAGRDDSRPRPNGGGEGEGESESEREGRSGDTDVGEECSDDDDCPGPAGGQGEAECLQSTDGFAEGYCTVLGCSPAEQNCDGGKGAAWCTAYPGEDQPICLERCEDKGDCRDGYACLPLEEITGPGPGGSVCAPLCRDDDDCASHQACDAATRRCHTAAALPGDPCEGPGDCPLAADCLSEAEFGYPGGACGRERCRSDGDCAAAGEGAVCALPPGEGSGRCLAACDAAGDCRGGWRCDRDLGACLPACEGGDDCGNGRLCAESGYCTAEWDAGDLGDPCRRADEHQDCAVGRCLFGEDGFPDGFCTTGDEKLCAASGGAWIDWHRDPFCAPRDCETDEAGACDDREGYRCVELPAEGEGESESEEEGKEGACLPSDFPQPR